MPKDKSAAKQKAANSTQTQYIRRQSLDLKEELQEQVGSSSHIDGKVATPAYFLVTEEQLRKIFCSTNFVSVCLNISKISFWNGHSLKI